MIISCRKVVISLDYGNLAVHDKQQMVGRAQRSKKTTFSSSSSFVVIRLCPVEEKKKRDTQPIQSLLKASRATAELWELLNFLVVFFFFLFSCCCCGGLVPCCANHLNIPYSYVRTLTRSRKAFSSPDFRWRQTKESRRKFWMKNSKWDNNNQQNRQNRQKK